MADASTTSSTATATRTASSRGRSAGLRITAVGASICRRRAPWQAGKGSCNISYGGHEMQLHAFELLTGHGARWEAPQPGLAGAFAAGQEHGQPLYLCQAEYNGGLHPGKVIGGHCDISFAGKEIPIASYRVLYAEQ